MSKPDKPWSVFTRIEPQPEPGNEKVYRVEFVHAGTGQAERGPNGNASRVGMPAVVEVNTEGGCKVTHYRPPEHPVPGFNEDDYKEKALEEVEKLLAKAK